jgi:hypothetical protein
MVRFEDYQVKEWITVRVSAAAEGNDSMKVRAFPALKALPTN